MIDGAESAFEILREPRLYSDDSMLSKTNCDIPMPNVKLQANNGDRICDTCNKEDV